jgi:hypothetical protein
VLALDHDLRVADDIIGSVFVRNPAGTKVALWEEVALDEGKESHCTCQLRTSSPYTGVLQLANIMCSLKCVCKLNIRKFNLFFFSIRYIVKFVNVNFLKCS